jgi:hypothetical protein
MLVKVLVASVIAIFGLMYWQAPEGRWQVGAVSPEPVSEWQKLRQQIQSHQHHFTHPTTPYRRQDAYRNVERASIPQLTESYRSSAMTPVQEEVADAPADHRPPAPVASASIPRRHAPKRTASRDHPQRQAKRIVRITRYEDGRAVGVRTFELKGAGRGGPAHRRYYVACPGGKCPSLTASMFGAGGRFN